MIADLGRSSVPATLTRPGAAPFWLAVGLTGLGTGLGASGLLLLLDAVQHAAWPGPGTLLDAARRTASWHRIVVLLGAGLVTGAGQFLFVRLTSGNSTDINEAIWFSAGRLPLLRTAGSAVLSIVIVSMGASLGREGAPKQAGAVFANLFSNRVHLPDEQRRLLVACGAGAGMAAAYGVPLGGALFAIEVLRGVLSLRLVLPALVTSLIATSVSWLVLPDAVTYPIPPYAGSGSLLVWVLVAAPIVGAAAVGLVRAVAWAERNKPKGWRRLVAPCVVLGVLGVVSIRFPALLGNGKDAAFLAFTGRLAPDTLVSLVLLKAAATLLCLRSGAPGGLFTPSLTIGAMLGGALGAAWSWFWPGVPAGAFAVIGAASLVAATTQGPISAVVLMFELTGQDRGLVIPLLLAVAVATLLARSIDARSIYDARLSDAEVGERLEQRERPFR